jgi:Protein of unknown function (DUF3592)
MIEMSDWVLAVIMLVFMAIPLLIGFLGVKTLRGALRARKHGAWVMGTVVEVKTIHSLGQRDGQQYSYQPIFEFAAPDGTTLRGEAGSYGQTNRYPVGSQREVLVDFDKPDMVFMSGWYRLAFGTIMIVFGLGCASFILFAVAAVLGG